MGRASIARVVGLLCTLCGLLARPAAAQTEWERTPYRVMIAVWTPEGPEFTPLWKQDCLESLRHRSEESFGAAWQVETSLCSYELSVAPLDEQLQILASEIPESFAAWDKLLVIRIEPWQEGYRVAARDYDGVTQIWSRPQSAFTEQWEAVPTEAFRLMVDCFAPLGKVELVHPNKTCVIRLKASSLPLADPNVMARLLPRQGVYRPVLRFNDKQGQPTRIQPIEWTYLVTKEFSGADVTCAVHSGLRSPLVSRVRGRTVQVALAVEPSPRPTRLTIVSRTDARRRLSGYHIYSHPADAPETKLLGTTDRLGQLDIPPAPAEEHPLRILILKNGSELLAKIPVLPGLFPEVTASVHNDDERLAVESFIVGLQEDLVDSIARRETLILRIRKRLQENKPNDAAKLLLELRQLKTRDQFVTTLDERRKAINTTDPRVRKQIDKLFGDTLKVVTQHMDPAGIDAVGSEVAAAGGKP